MRLHAAIVKISILQKIENAPFFALDFVFISLNCEVRANVTFPPIITFFTITPWILIAWFLTFLSALMFFTFTCKSQSRYTEIVFFFTETPPTLRWFTWFSCCSSFDVPQVQGNYRHTVQSEVQLKGVWFFTHELYVDVRDQQKN